MSEIGIINEQGDMGLGWNPLGEEDNTRLNEQQEKEDKENGAS